MHWTIGKKLYVSFGIVMVLVAISSTVAYVKMTQIIAAQNRAAFRTTELNLVNEQLQEKITALRQTELAIDAGSLVLGVVAV